MHKVTEAHRKEVSWFLIGDPQFTASGFLTGHPYVARYRPPHMRRRTKPHNKSDQPEKIEMKLIEFGKLL